MFSSFSGSFKFGRRRPFGPPPFVGFTNFTFTSGGLTGRTGPDLNTLLNSYDTSANPWLLDDTQFDMITNGYQLWTVPETGTYRITARGAQGAPIEAAAGGRGAIITGDFNLTAGEKLQILVGQIARPREDRVYRSSPGGGGSFIVKYTGETNIIDDILLVAGGGGGTGSDPIDPQSDAQTGTAAGRGRRNNFNNGGVGGVDGNGGTAGDASNGAGGGFLTDGSNTSGARGLSFLNGGLGGTISSSWNLEGGGFGGGGAPVNGDLNRFAAGGGFSGGGSTNSGGSAAESNTGGGGGGSYNAGANPSALGGTDGNYGGGSVYVELLNAD
jgi:hypothetical protein